MQKVILSQKKLITLLSGIIIVIGYFSRFILGNVAVLKWALIIASVIGIAPIAIQAYQALKVKVVSIDVLVTIAVIGAFFIRNFEESAIVTFLFLFGHYLEQRTLNQTRSAIRELTEMAPESALVQTDSGEFEEVDIDEVDEGDILLVKTGDKVPVDGTVLSGNGYINEASITGESVPVTKSKDSSVYAGTILENGTIQVLADRVGEETTFGKIIELVEEAQDSKSEAERFIDKFSKYYTPAVLLLSFLVWLISQDIELAITTLVLGCPGALVIGVPVSNVAGIGNGARHGVLLKGSEVIHDFSRVDTIVFDKTGTLTVGNPSVALKVVYGKNPDEAVNYLASVEIESDHPLAKAILKETKAAKIYPVEETEVVKGGGIVARVDGHRVAVGNVALMDKEGIELSEKVKEDIQEAETSGNSLVLTAVDGDLRILMGIRDQVRPGVKQDLKKLKNLGVKNLVVLSGDNQGTVDVVASELGLTEAHGHMLPEDKSAHIEKLQKEGRIVGFVGDGVNDSPSLALADIGIAMGSGTDVAIETSDVVLMNSDFSRLPHALGLVKATANNMYQNIALAVGVVLVLLASVFFSDWMNMSIGMLVHESSILVVIFNGMRLLKYRLRGSRKRQEVKRVKTA
ncbi:Cd2+/Zn2+-exporting ATPase [Alkalibacterium subtropicum]|uniref:Cd(2+)-exporting ATPase n=1 Tax=Alkalibacterium subtropicum TaxID=753702 RepID=A0A1I1L5G9_9LACT|nr:heavy metal translocating P-type ATPase [Alkalibacterium subtropicum]SFC65673.1 Cd2+/Zn2+-exporting ATPase [Alkalibacterium subtropicum]